MKTPDTAIICSQLSKVFGFPLIPGAKFQLDGNDYCLMKADIEALELLAEIRAAWPTAANVYWLLPFRDVVRQCRGGTIFAYAARGTRDPATRCLAVWLRGHRGGKLGSPTIASLYWGSDATVRKAVVRALQRMHAWSWLRRIEACEPEPRIRRLARQKKPRAYDSRMTQFIEHVTPCKSFAGEASLYERAGLELEAGVQPRPQSFFRIILQRIRRLVRGEGAASHSSDLKSEI